MDIADVKRQYEELKRADDPFDSIFEFKAALLASHSPEFLEFHYALIQDRSAPDEVRSTIKTFFSAEAANQRDAATVGEFLYSKYRDGVEDLALRGDLIQFLGTLRSPHARPVALENLAAEERDLRFRGIIVLGWVGTKDDLPALDERLRNDPDAQLRGYAATAMRQVWFNHGKTKDAILAFLQGAIVGEDEEEALEGIILTAQELLKKKLGLKESKYGDVSGDMAKAKTRTLAALERR